jgi:hypothetical protein
MNADKLKALEASIEVIFQSLNYKLTQAWGILVLNDAEKGHIIRKMARKMRKMPLTDLVCCDRCLNHAYGELNESLCCNKCKSCKICKEHLGR